MSGTYYRQIRAVANEHEMSIVGPRDYVSDVVGEIDPQKVRADPRFSLYCIDLAASSAIFVESNDPDAVDRAVFYYQGQRQHAVGLVSMPMSVFDSVAAQIPEPAKGVIFVHSVGRCGSTLLSKVLGAIPAVHSVSEPDDLTQLEVLVVSGEVTEPWAERYLRSSIKWRGKPTAGGQADYLAIKARSEVMALADLIGRCFTQDKHLFLYRDAIAWMRTIFRAFSAQFDVYDQETNRKWERTWARMLPLVNEYAREDAPMNVVQVRILGWITCMEGYLRLRDMGLSTCAARFEDLTADPRAVLSGIFEFCGIAELDWSAVDEVLARDSQAGTTYDREVRRKLTRELTEELERDARDLIATRPLLGTPDVRLPGTLEPR